MDPAVAGDRADAGSFDHGNIIRRGAQTFGFDQGNRMTRAAGKATYGYDGLGHRVSVVGTDGVNRVQVYSQGGQLLYTLATSAPLAGASGTSTSTATQLPKSKPRQRLLDDPY